VCIHELRESGPDGDAADAKLLTQVFLGRQLRADGVFARGDLTAKPIRDLLIERGRAMTHPTPPLYKELL
jgi:hypothetical protein